MCGSCGKGGSSKGGFGKYKKGQKRVRGLKKRTFAQLKKEIEDQANAKSK
jgi:hypothetical protein